MNNHRLQKSTNLVISDYNINFLSIDYHVIMNGFESRPDR